MVIRLLSLVAFLSLACFPLSAYEQPPVEPGFELLFDGKDLTKHFHIKGKESSWKVVDGVIVASSGGNRIISKKAYENYVLRLEWNVGEGGNSGVFVHVPSPDDNMPWVTGHEIQISDERPYRKPKNSTGAIYDRAESTAGPIKPGIWHNYEIICLKGHITVKLDGKVVCEGKPDSEGLKGTSTRGHVGLQDYHHHNNKGIQYRNIRIQPLNPDGTVVGFTDVTNDEANWQKIKTGHGSGGQWVLQNGVWTGEQDPPGSGNGGILVHKKPIGDFELILETQPDWGVCSGVFLRSTMEGACYQVMVDYNHRHGNIGGVYGEGTGAFVHKQYNLDKDQNLILTPPEGTPPKLRFKPEEWARYWDKDGWNEIRSRIRGNPPTVETWLNGTPIADFKDDQKRLPNKGHIGIQVHGGKEWPKGSKVRFRKIQVREISGS